MSAVKKFVGLPSRGVLTAVGPTVGVIAFLVIFGMVVGDPADNLASGIIVNNSSKTITLQACGNGCTPSGITETDVVLAHRSLEINLCACGINPWLVIQNGQIIGCLPLFLSSDRAGSTVTTKAFPLQRKFSLCE